MSDNRRTNGTFGEGNAANAGGHNASPVIRKIRAALREGAPDAVGFLRRVINGEEAEAKIGDRVRACEVLLSRAIAPPTQRHKVAGKLDTNPLAGFSTEQLAEWLAARKGAQ